MENEIQTVHNELSMTDVQTRIDDMITNRAHMIAKVRPLLIEGTDFYRLPGMKKDSLGKPGAEKLASFYALRASFKIDNETMDALGDMGDKKFVAYVCTLTYNGIFAGEGRGAAFVELMRNSYRRIFNSDKASLTAEETAALKGPFKGTSKTGSTYEYWKLQEEPVFDPLALNKTIKMAQKSAFVDAVIRATGMSDLFTQDVEDGVIEVDEQVVHQEAKPAAKPTTKAETPNYGTSAHDEYPPEPVPDHAPEDQGELCAACGKGHYKLRNGARGEFYGCSNYPTCKSTKDSMA